MGDAAVVGGRAFDGGISYRNLEVLNIQLGYGNDHFTVESTHRNLTFITSANGDDVVDVKSILGHTIIQTGNGNDTINLRSNDLVLDQISGMLVVDGGAGTDVLNVQDNSSIGVLETDGAGLLSVTHTHTLTVYAANGRYTLRSVGFGLGGGLTNSQGITRFNGYAEATLNFNMSGQQVDQALETLFGTNNFTVTETRTATAVTYLVQLTGPTSSQDAWVITVRNAPPPAGNTGTLTDTTITGLDMYTLSEVQKFTVQAKSGSFVLRVPGYGLESGLPDSDYVARYAGYADVILDYNFTADDVAARLREAYGSLDLEVSASRTITDATYTVTFARSFAGRDFPLFTWAPYVLAPVDITQPRTLASMFQAGESPLGDALRARFSAATVALIDQGAAADYTQLRRALFTELNAIISSAVPLYNPALFIGVTLRPETQALVAKNPAGVELAQLQRMLLEDAFPTIAHSDLVANEDASTFVVTSTVREGTTVPGVGVTSQQVLDFRATGGFFRIGFRLDQAAVDAINHGLAETINGVKVIANAYVPQIVGTTVWTAAIPYDATADQLRQYLDPILNPNNADLDLPHTHNYEVNRTLGALVFTFEGAYRGLSIYPADLDSAPTGFVPLAGTLRLPDQTVTVNATGGTFKLGLRLNPADQTQITWTNPIASNASANDVVAELSRFLDAANLTTPLTDAPHSANVGVIKQGNVYTITFQGAFANLRLQPQDVDASLLDLAVGTTTVRGSAALATQLEGINYYAFETLNIDLSAGSDIFNIRSTADGVVTNVRTNDGDDRIYVSSQADRRPDNLAGYDYLNGSLEGIRGTLNIDGGAGRQTLMISDESGTAATPGALITDQVIPGLVELPNSEIRLVGLAGQIDATHPTDGIIIYGANAAEGNFANGITLWTGFGDDTLTIDGTEFRDGLRTITTLNTGLGNDNVTVNLTAGQDDFFVLNTQGAYHDQPATSDDDIVDGSLSTLPLIVFGGQGNDHLTGGTANDLLFGDRGQVLFLDGSTVVTALGHAGPGDFTDGTIRPAIFAFTEYAEIGGNDTIIGREGRDVIFGGQGDDTLYGFDLTLTGADIQPDVLVGDSGLATYVAGVLVDVHTIAPAIGGNDTITAGLGGNVILGGQGGDTIHAGGDAQYDVVLGDNGRATYDAATGLLVRAETTDAAIGGADTIDGGDSTNVILGGADGDTITTFNPTARNFILGDNGVASFDLLGLMIRFATTDPAIGGNDNITTGAANDLIAGGAANDTVHAGAGEDFVLGDNGVFDFDADANHATLDQVYSTDPTIGGDDTLFGDAGEDYLFGGTANDTINGGDGHDVLLGDHGLWSATLALNQNFVSLFTAATDGGGNDTIHGDAGDDFILGQQGDDHLYGGAGNDDLTGGHNVLYGADGNDYLDGGDEAVVTVGDGADVLLGDNGLISREVLTGTPSSTWRTYPAPFATIVIRTVVRFDDIDFVGGNDTLLGDADQDILHGQRGNDVLDGGAGDDEVYGELGSDIASGGDGNDVVLGDVGLAQRAFNADGTPRIDTNGSWHRDILLEDVGRLTAAIKMDVHPLRLDDPALAAKLMNADLAILGGTYLPGGDKLVNPDSGAWNTELLLIDLVAADNDTVNGGAGDDLLFGQRGNDTINGGDGADLIFADGAFNSVPFGTNLPQIVSGVLLIGVDAGVPYSVAQGGSVIVPNMALQPLELNTTVPQLTFVPNLAFGDLAAADSLRRNDGADTLPLLSFVPDLVHHIDVLPGNDIIDGGAGGDTIYADDMAVSALPFQGISALDTALSDVRNSVFQVLAGLHYLSLDFDELQQLVGGAVTQQDIRIGNDIIAGGDGNDFIYGDNSIIAVPFATGNPSAAADFTTSALRYHSFLRDLQYVTMDFLNTVQEAHLDVLHSLVDHALALNPDRNPTLFPKAVDPNYHHLFLGNDQIDGGLGTDVIIGDNGATLTPVLGNFSFLNVTSALGITPQVLKDTQAALANQQKIRAAELSYHLAVNVGNWNDLRPSTADLHLVPAVFEYDLDLGNDILRGGADNDLIIGDNGAIVVPVIADPNATKAVIQANIGRLLTDLDVLLGNKTLKATYQFSPALLGHSGGNRGISLRSGYDMINGDAGDDILFAKDAAVVVPFASATPNQLVQLDFGFSHVATNLAFLNRQATLLSGRAVLAGKDQLMDKLGKNTILTQTGNISRNVILAMRSLIFNAMPPQLRQFLVDVGATGGAILPGGDVSVLPPGGTVLRQPTLNVTVSTVTTNGRKFDLTAMLNGVILPSNAVSVWELTDSTGKVLANGTGPKFSFTALKAGDYHVRLIVTDVGNGTFGMTVATIHVNTDRDTINAGLDGPVSGFAGHALPFHALLDDVAAPTIYNAVWQVFDASNTVVDAGVGRDYTFTPGVGGTYTVQLKLTDPTSGISAIVTQQVVVSATAPTLPVGITGPAQGIRGHLFTFAGQLNGAAFGGNYQATWLVFDHKNAVVATGTGSQFLFLPQTPGEYRVQLQLVDPHGGSFGVGSCMVDVDAPAPTFTGGLTGPTTGLRGHAASFTALANGAALPTGYRAEWQVFNAAHQVIATGLGEHFAYLPSATGAYTVELLITDPANGGTAVADASLFVSQPAPTTTVGISGPTQGLLHGLLSFGGLVDGTAFAGNYTGTWTVTLPDNSTITAQGREFAYAPVVVGPYTVEFSVDDNGQTASASLQVNVTATVPASPVPHTIGLTIPREALVGQPLHYTALLDGAEVPPAFTVNWRITNLGLGTVDTGTGADFIYTVATSGNYQVEATITDSSAVVIGKASTLLSDVATTSLLSGITGPLTGVAGQLRTFTALLATGGIASGQTGLWIVTDSTNTQVGSGAGDQLIFAAPAAGAYTVYFTLTDTVTGATSTTAVPFSASATAPALALTFTGPTVGLLGSTLHFGGLLDSRNIPASFVKTWTVLDGGTAIATGTGDAFTLVPAALGQYVVRFDVADPATGALGSVTAPLNIAPSQPALGLPIIAGLTGPVVGALGQPLTFTGIVDGQAPDNQSLTSWTVTDDHNTIVAQGSGATFTYAAAELGRHSIRFSVQVDGGAMDTTDLAFDVVGLGVVPAAGTGLGIAGPAAGVRGQTLSFNALLNGAPIVGDYDAVWRALDGTGNVVAVGRGHDFAFTPQTEDSFQVEFTLANRTNGDLLTSSVPVAVSRFLVVPDAANPGRSILLVGGSRGGDVITLDKSRTTDDTVTLTLDERELGTAKLTQDFTAVSRVMVWGGLGDDQITIGSTLELVPAVLDGGAGRDTLTGGKSADVLFGGFGADVLTGGDGDDLLDGGQGNDRVSGGKGNDSLIARDGHDLLTGEADSDTFTLEPAIHGTNIIADGGAGDDVFNVPASASGTSLHIITGLAGTFRNRVNVGSAAGLLPTTGGIIDGVLGSVDVISSAKSDSIIVDDSASRGAKTWKLVNGTLTTGTGAITVHGAGALSVLLGSGDDHVLVNGTALRTSFDGGAGADVFDVVAVKAGTALDIVSGSGVGTLNLGASSHLLAGLKGLVLFEGNGSDIVNLDNTASKAATVGKIFPTNITGFGTASISPLNIAQLNVHLGSGADSVTVSDTPINAATAIDTGAGRDVVNILATNSALTVDTGAGADTVNLGSKRPAAGGVVSTITAPLTLLGGTGPKEIDLLTVDDTGTLNGNTGAITLTQLTGLGLANPIDYSAFESVKIALGPGDDTFTLAPGTATYTKVTPGKGNNTIL